MPRRSETNPPYQSLEFEVALRTEFAKAGVEFSDDAHALRDVSVVGAVFSMDGKIFYDDAATIRNILVNLSKAGIPLHWSSQFHFYNLIPPVESDFLKTNYPDLLDEGQDPIRSDVLITCGVSSSPPGTYNTYEILPSYRHVGFADLSNLYGDADRYRDHYVNRLTAVSAYQDPEVWQDCAEAIGAKFIVTRGGVGDEISTQTFAGPNFKVLVDSAERFEMQYGAISGGLGILIREGYGDDLRRTFNRKALLGARAYASVAQKLQLQKFPKTGKFVMRMA